MTLTYGSLFTGLGGFDMALDDLGMECLWQAEKDDACNSVLRRHWPKVRRIDDVLRARMAIEKKHKNRCSTKPLRRPDIIVGGFPCQDLSVAGRRAGLAGARSGLFWTMRRIIAILRPPWFILENVPGLLSSNKGRDMGAILKALGDIGYGWAYRCLDAQHFGLAQRRNRVFIVGYSGGLDRPMGESELRDRTRLSRVAASVLFESDCLPWDSSPSSKTREKVAGTIGGGSGKRGWCDDTDRATFVASDYKTGGYEKSSVARPITQGTDGSRSAPLVAERERVGTGAYDRGSL